MAIERDPVCGMDVDTEAKSENHVEYQGKTYWFCSRGCMLDFQDDPEQYLRADYRPHM
jgi:YHS domain-containing protein